MNSDASSAFERLLYVVTARGKINWRQWKEACRSLAETDAEELCGLTESSVARFLDELGHVDMIVDESSVAIVAAPAVLALLPVPGTLSAVLCGGRAPDSERCLREAADRYGARVTIRHPAVEDNDTRSNGPKTIKVEANDIDSLKQIAADTGLSLAKEPPAWVLAHVAGSIEDYTDKLKWQYGPEQNVKASEWCTTTLRFISPRPHIHATRLIRYVPRIGAPYYELRKGEKAAHVDRQWGIYACLHASDTEIVIHDRRKRALAVPSCAPLPRPLGRTLALCSGESPFRYRPPESVSKRMIPHSEYLIYYDIPANIAMRVLACLGQTALPFSLPDKPRITITT